ncbi:hypothetical protein ACH35V_07675 [Actinomadura sp. 1N219]|uniref:hypothetical protein n=1 Tax=Actinomadura sp. 1N219 TaxID=3375152 RepID=UPI0037A3500C
MTAKTTRDGTGKVPDEADAAPQETEAPEETEVAERPARPAARRKRRVRVIEVIDDEDLDEVLEALDAEDEQDEEPEEAPAPRLTKSAARPAKPAAKPAAKAAKPAAKAVPKPRPSRIEAPDEEPEEKEPVVIRSTVFGLGTAQAVVVVVLVALLASLAIWQWRSASSNAAKEDDRAAVSKVASAYGNAAFSYNAQNYQTQAEKAQKLMAGDLLDEFKKNTMPSLTNAFKSDAQVAVTSKTDQVFVGSVDGRFATAVVMVEVSLKTKDGQATEPATLLRLSLSKVDGEWKVTQQYASGINEQNKNQQPGQQLPGVPGGGASKSPKAEKSGTPGN